MVTGRARSVSTAAVSFLVMFVALSSNGRTLDWLRARTASAFADSDDSTTPRGMRWESFQQESASALHRAGVLGRKPADRRPVELVAAMGQQGQEPVAQEAGERQRHAQIVSGRESEANILIAEGRREPGRLELSIDDQPAIGLVDGNVEQRRGQHVEILPPVDAGFAHQRHGLAERFDHRSEQEVAAELHEIGGLRRLGDDEVLFPIASKSGAAALTASGAPAATTKSWPAAATSGRPNTGAATKRCSAFAWAASSLSDRATLMVLEEMWIAGASRLPMMLPSPNTTLSTVSSFASMVITASPLQASETLAAAFAPCATRASTFGRVRL